MVRKPRVSLSLTPAAAAVLDALTNATELSRSALVEQVLQGKVAFEGPAIDWTVSIQDTEAGPTVASVSSGPPTSSPAATADPTTPVPETPIKATDAASVPTSSGTKDDRTAEIKALQQQLADLTAQLAAARTPAPTAPPAVETPAPVTSSVGESSGTERVSDPAPALQQQLVAAIAAQADLQTQLQDQTQELTTLRQQLAQQQSLAAVGEHQLNRWRYHTYAQ